MERAAAHPELQPWVGAMYEHLAGAPASFRRIVTRPPTHVIFYQYQVSADGREIVIVRVRSVSQAPLSDRDLGGAEWKQ